MQYKKLFISVLFLLSQFFVAAQQNDLFAVCRQVDDSIVVRWAPRDYPSLMKGVQQGYFIKRTTVKRNGKLLSSNEAIASKITLHEELQPLTPEEWEALASKNNMAGVAAISIYGESFEEVTPETGFTEILVQQQENEKRFQYALLAADLSFDVAKAIGIGLVDTMIHENEEYLYEINYVGETTYPALCVFKPYDQKELPEATELKAFFGDKSTMFSWEGDSQVYDYCTYQIERSTSEGTLFEKVNKQYLFSAAHPETGENIYMYRDSLDDNETVYYYRIRGQSIFGELGPPSNVIKGQGKESRMNLSMRIKSVHETTEKTLQITWEYNTSVSEKIKQINVLRSGTKFGDYMPVNEAALTGTETQYIDKAPLRSAYYIIEVEDINGYTYRSFSALALLSDLESPEKPDAFLEAFTDESGSVTIKWHPNNEDDLKGYKVYYANQKRAEFTQLTTSPIQDTFFRHQLNMGLLNEEVYFKVLATDFHENNSYFSDIIIVKKPDIHPPSAPVFTKVMSEKEGVVMRWANSSSKDIYMHKVLRRAQNTLIWDTIYVDTLARETYSSLIDSTGKPKKIYEYRVMAIDDDGLSSVSNIVSGQKVDDGSREEIKDFHVRYIRFQKTGYISWLYESAPEEDQIEQFILYRGVNDRPATTYKTFGFDQVYVPEKSGGLYNFFEFEDKNLLKGSKYHYQLIVKFKSGAYSPLTEKITVP